MWTPEHTVSHQSRVQVMMSKLSAACSIYFYLWRQICRANCCLLWFSSCCVSYGEHHANFHLVECDAIVCFSKASGPIHINLGLKAWW